MSDPLSRLNAALSDRYAIGARLGEGGMATVYLADDLKHDRKVAIKVLRPELAAVIGGERFVAEIKTTAGLQHPHILPLFDSGEADGFLYYVMPFVEGESLRERLDRHRQLPVEDAVRIARAVGSALHYAHERGIVHRDIKPGNILLHAGEPVVADFGIALAISAAGGGRLTETGMSVGTPHYMSPEQASADRDIDARSDTYALACVLYEMLAGDPPHTGPSAQAILVRILTETPRDLTDVRRSVPNHVRDAVIKGLEKLPADRFATAKDFADALADSSFRYRPVVADAPRKAPATTSEGAWRRPSVWAIPAAAIVGLGAGALLTSGDGPPRSDAPATRLELGLEVLTLQRPEVIHVSPDGDQFAFVGDRGVEDGIYTRAADEVEFRHMEGTEDASFMAFSPDGDWIAFVADDGSIKRIPASGGSSRVILPRDPEGRAPLFVTWGADDYLLYVGFGQQPGVVARVPASGGEVEVLMEGQGDLMHSPQMLPDGRTLMVSATGTQDVLLHDTEADSTWTLLSATASATLLPTGELIYVDTRGGMWAAPFDLERRDFSAEPVPVLTGVLLSGGVVPSFSVSRTGTLTYLKTSDESAGPGGMQSLRVFSFQGGSEEIPIAGRRYRNVRWSPDGRSVAFAGLEPGQPTGRSSIYTYNVELRTATRRLTDEGTQAFPVWSPDGGRIAYLDAQSLVGPDGTGMGPLASGDLSMVDAGGGTPEPLVQQEGQDVPYHWTSDGRVVFTGGPDAGSSNLLLAAVDRPGEVGTYLDIDGDLGSVVVSPDRRWAAFLSSEAPGVNNELVVRSFPEPGTPIQVSEGGGDRPRWSRTGDRLFYWKTEGDLDSLMMASVQTRPTFRVLSTELVLSGDFEEATWDLHPDGDRMVVAVSEGAATGEGAATVEPPVPLAVVNWFTELRAALGNED
jgi:serine/threonine-protein kinase